MRKMSKSKQDILASKSLIKLSSEISGQTASKPALSTIKVLPEPDYAQELVLYFYSELLKYVVVENDGKATKPRDASDDEPIYDKDKAPSTSSSDQMQRIYSKFLKKEKSMHATMSKLAQSEDAVKDINVILSSGLTNYILEPDGLQDGLPGIGSKKVGKDPEAALSNVPVTRTSVGPDEVSQFSSESAHQAEMVFDDGDDNDALLSWMVKGNKRCEQVEMRFTTGVVYIGEMLRNRFDGEGCYRWPDGTYYDGQFTQGSITGFGKLTYNNMSYYHGRLINCILEGLGVYTPLMEGMQYSGDWASGVPEGKGLMRYGDHDSYNGYWTKGKKHGAGTRTYRSGSVYSGNWFDGRQNRHGSMLLYNCDFYEGQWSNGLPNGYGEYTWSSQLSQGLTFSIEKQYFGNFVDGQRDGYGVQIFGMDGSKIASLFEENAKSGAGIIVCGDGTTIERKPLFMADIPTQKRASFSTSQNQNGPGNSNRVSMRQSRTSSSTRIKSVLNINNLIKETFPDFNFDDRHSKINETFRNADIVCLPMYIPVHATAKDINLDYHIHRLMTNFDANERVSGQHSAKQLREMTSTVDNEIRLLNRVISMEFVYLKQIYNKYCTLNILEKCCPEFRKPVMSRLHLWQFLRDMDIYKFHISLYDVDMMMLNVPGIHLESEHDPFENIYMWQFFHCLLTLSYQMFISEEYYETTKDTGTYQALFHKFIDEIIKPNEGKFAGRCLFHFRDVLPIKAVHNLYRNVGEPHTARTLLNRICNRTGDEPLSCKMRRRYVYNSSGTYRHYVINGSNCLYLKEKNKDPWEPDDPKILNKYANDPFHTDLRVFRVLGPKNVMTCIANICPNIAESGDIVFIDYQITFLEFYEILFELADELRKEKMRIELAERAKQEREAAEIVYKKAKVQKSVQKDLDAIGSTTSSGFRKRMQSKSKTD